MSIIEGHIGSPLNYFLIGLIKRDTTLEEHEGEKGFYDWLKSQPWLAKTLYLRKGLIIWVA